MPICGTGNKSCAICGNGSGGCLTTMREDCFCLASERQLVERLNKNEYPEKRLLMISVLKVEYNHEYTGYEELKPLPKQLNCCTQARYSRDSEGGEHHMYLEEALLEMITKGKKIQKTGSESVIAYDPEMRKICYWHEEADEKGSHYGCEVAFTDADRTSNQWGVISDLRRICRPEIVIEYESVTQIPIFLLAICRFGIKKVNIDLMCGEYKLGVIKGLIIPKYRFKKI